MQGPTQSVFPSLPHPKMLTPEQDATAATIAATATTIMAPKGVLIAIDRGGTFTDAWAQIPGREEHVILKVLSESPDEYSDAPTECIRQILEIATGNTIPRDTPLDLECVESIRMGTTVATNALLERKGERVAFITTKGFRDVLRIGNQARPDLFDLSVQRLDKLYETVLEVDERVTIEGWAEDPEPQPIHVSADPDLREGLTGEAVRVLKAPDLEAVRRDLRGLWDKGFRDVAVAFMHSYTFPNHERIIADLAEEMGFKVAASARLLSMAKLVPRSQSAVADAYLSPVTARYLESFRRGFKGLLEDDNGKKLFLNQSDGGLTNFKNFAGLRGVLSGPAGGVVGVSRTCYHPDDATPVLGFDSKLSAPSPSPSPTFPLHILTIQCPQTQETNKETPKKWVVPARMSPVTRASWSTSSRAPSQKSQSRLPS